MNTFNLPPVIISPRFDSGYLLYCEPQTFLTDFPLILLFFLFFFLQPFLYFLRIYLGTVCLVCWRHKLFCICSHTQTINIGLSKQIRGAHFWIISASLPLEPAGMPRSQSLLETQYMKRGREAERGGGRERVKWQFNPPWVLSRRCFADCALFGNFEIGPGFHVQDKVESLCLAVCGQ